MNLAFSFSELLSGIFPEFCIGCQNDEGSICKKCLQKIKPLNDIKECIICENPSINGFSHKSCLKNYSFAPINLNYDYEYSHLVKLCIIKSKSSSQNHKLLSELLDKSIALSKLTNLPIDYIVAAPSSKRVLSRKLSTNPEKISSHISKLYNIPIFDCLYKNPFASKQSALPKELRFNNAVNNIHLHEKLIHNTNITIHIKNKTVLLVDDVITTGATILACSKLLYNCGAKSVYSYALAKDIITL